MILVDTSIWIDLLRGSGPLGEMLSRNEVQTHPFVIGELACGSLPDRPTTLKLLLELPSVRVAGNSEVLFFIEKHNLMARGVGYVDMHLLASAALDACKLFTRDKRLHNIADELALAHVVQRKT
ncbi:PIN domain-containing protein [Massilia sp. RP-1-19]|uniref:PIN domain-containing protein n=1 Tax=Massilia polaris TaxID=2728846 RepID=A0A848HQ36_9BURK|nr:PIN domain-containing protein [Massilia polaris]NML63462.1 PIN domain-containing protein [Massilia polaris]